MDKVFTEYIDMEGAGSYGYGWMLLDSGVGKTIFHGGNTLGFISNLLRFVDIDLTIIILTNVGYYDVNTLTNILTSISFGGEHEVPVALKEIELEDINLDLYVGTY